MLFVNKLADALGSGELDLVSLDEGVGVGIEAALFAGHGGGAGVGLAGGDGIGHIEGVLAGHVIGVAGAAVALVAGSVNVSQLDLQAGHAVLLHLFPGTGEVALGVSGVGGGVRGVVVGEGVLVADGGAVGGEGQQEGVVEHGSVFALLFKLAFKLEGLAGSLFRAAFGSGSGGLGSGGGGAVSAGGQSQDHAECQDQCKDLFQVVFLLFFFSILLRYAP